MKAPAWLVERFRMTAEARFRWQVTYRKPVTAIVVAGALLVIAGLFWNGHDRWIVFCCGLAAWLGCGLVRLLASDRGAG